MSKKGISVDLHPTEACCMSCVEWDAESITLFVKIVNERSAKIAKPVFSEKINEALNIQDSEWRIAVGDLDIALGSNKEISSLEIRTNPVNWKEKTLKAIPPNIGNTCLSFPICFDENHLASVEEKIEVQHDRVKHELAFCIGDNLPSSWFIVADNLLVGVCAESLLCELRLTAFMLTAE